MKSYKIIATVLSAIIGIVIAVCLNLASPGARLSYTGSIASESYQILKDYAFEIASFDTEPREDIVVTKNLTKESLVVDVDASIYGVEAIFPISNFEVRIENGIIQYEVVIDYNNVTYLEHIDVEPPLFYILISIVIAFLWGVLFWFLIYYSILLIKSLTKKN